MMFEQVLKIIILYEYLFCHSLCYRYPISHINHVYLCVSITIRSVYPLKFRQTSDIGDCCRGSRSITVRCIFHTKCVKTRYAKAAPVVLIAFLRVNTAFQKIRSSHSVIRCLNTRCV